MLHLLPEAYKKELQKEYKLRVWVAASNILAFCTFVFILGLAPAFIMMSFSKNELKKQVDNIIVVPEADIRLAESFEAAIKKSLEVVAGEKIVSSEDLDQVLAIDRNGIILKNILITEDRVELKGMAATRNDLSVFVKNVNDQELYKAQDVPAATFKKDKDLDFSLILDRIKN